MRSVSFEYFPVVRAPLLHSVELWKIKIAQSIVGFYLGIQT